MKSNAYYDFLLMKAQIQQEQAFPTLTPEQDVLLDAIYIAWSNHEKLGVTNAIKLNNQQSDSTNFKHLKNLRKLKLVSIIDDESDGRIKYVIPSEAALNYYHALNTKIVDTINAEFGLQ